MFRLFTVLFGISLFVVLGSITITRQSNSTAFWLLTKQEIAQRHGYRYVLSLPDGRASRIIASPADAASNVNWFIDWLPGDNSILYLDKDVYKLNVQSGAAQRLINTTGTVIGFDTLLSPDGDWLLLELRNGVNTQLFRLDTNGHKAQLIDDVLSVTSNMSWSSNGDTIYFVNFSSDHYRPLASDGQTISEVTWGERFEQFSPDGTHKAFYRQDDQYVWYIEELATGKTTQLTPPSAQFHLLDWLPNNWILLAEIQDRINPDFDNKQRYYRIRPDGTDLSELIVVSAGFGTRAAPFWTNEWFYINSPDHDKESLYRVNIKNGQTERVIDDFLPFAIDEIVDLYDGTARIVRLIGDWLIWRTPGDDMKFVQTRLDGSGTRAIYDFPDGAKTPRLAASPDNKWLYVSFFDRSGNWFVDRVNLMTQNVEHVFSGDQNLLSISPQVDVLLRPYLSVLVLLVILTITVLIFFK